MKGYVSLCMLESSIIYLIKCIIVPLLRNGKIKRDQSTR